MDLPCEYAREETFLAGKFCHSVRSPASAHTTGPFTHRDQRFTLGPAAWERHRWSEGSRDSAMLRPVASHYRMVNLINMR